MCKIMAAKPENKEAVNKLYDDAKEYFKQNAINQWQSGYPNAASFLLDVENEESFIVVKNSEIAATFMYSEKPEPTYKNIYEGEWKYKGDYAVIHRVAVSPKLKGEGIMALIISFAAKKAAQGGFCALRCDTHKDNISMQRALSKNGFIYSGIVFLDDKKADARFVYEYKLNLCP